MALGPTGIDSEYDSQEEIISEINMTPLIDIMLVLLIIFMVTSSISLESGLSVDLPTAASSAEGTEEGLAVIVTLDQSGTIAVQGTAVSLEGLSEAIKLALAQDKTDLVVFEGDRRSQFGKAVEIMDIAKASGAKRFAIAAEAATP